VVGRKVRLYCFGFVLGFILRTITTSGAPAQVERSADDYDSNKNEDENTT
jgi:hypothetical protein